MAEGGCGFERWLLEPCQWHGSTTVASVATEANPPPDGQARVWQCGYGTAPANHGRHAPNPQERQVSTRPIRRKERSFDDEIYQHGPFVTIYCRLRRYPVGAHSVRPDSAKSYGSWANNVRPYGSAGADEFTNGVPRSYPRAPSLAALPRQSEFTTGRAGRHVAVRPWAAIANHGRRTPNPKAKQALRFHHLTKPKHML